MTKGGVKSKQFSYLAELKKYILQDYGSATYTTDLDNWWNTNYVGLV
jgi:hypothetical protein